jgi:hypothetical protein
MSEPQSPSTAVTAPPAQSKKPDDTSAFKQQRMPAWQPVMSPPYVISCFLIIGCIFIPIGIVVIVTSDKIIEVRERYDHLVPSCGDFGKGCNHTMTITVPSTMDPPVLMYYQLDNFYQNHRRYAKSRSDLQLAGELPDAGSLGDCDPFLHLNSYRGGISGGFQVTLPNGQPFDAASVPYNPCGLIAWSMFNDSFTLRRKNNGATLCAGHEFTATGEPWTPGYPCEKKGIAWPSDPGVKYTASPVVQPDPNGAPLYYGHQGWNINYNASHDIDRFAANGYYIGEEGHQVPDPQDLDLMVWMRLASLSTFRKLYRKVTVPLEADSYELTIWFKYPVSTFKGKKYFVLTTTSWLGGKNYVLGALYIATGVISMILGLAFLAKYLLTPRRIGAL